MIPTQGGDAVTPRHLNFEATFVVFEREDIFAVIGTQINAVFVSQFVIEFGIEVIKEIA